jgi:peptidoglycan hydrolase-like protein with peptidoglycan-binding domain
MLEQNPSRFGWRAGSAADIVPFSYGRNSFPSGVARGTEPLWTAALDLICREPGFVMPDPRPTVGGCWGFVDRLKKSGNGTSFHAYGLAIDVAAPWNGYNVPWPPASPHRLPAATGHLVAPLGILWGGTFSGPKDWMHLELHLDPAEVAAWNAGPVLPFVNDAGLLAWPLAAGCYYGPRSGPANSISNLVRPTETSLAGLKWAQARLGCVADGLYGPATAAAARSWQQAHGLVADGLIGPRTWSSLSG